MPFFGMKLFCALLLLPCVVFASLENDIKDKLADVLESGSCSFDVGAKTFTYTGKDQTFTVPSTVSKLLVHLWGAGGGGGETSKLGAKGGRHDGQSSGGGGGFTMGALTVKPGQKLTVIVGQGTRCLQNTTCPRNEVILIHPCFTSFIYLFFHHDVSRWNVWKRQSACRESDVRWRRSRRSSKLLLWRRRWSVGHAATKGQGCRDRGRWRRGWRRLQ